MKQFSLLLAVALVGVSCERHEFEGPEGTKQLHEHGGHAAHGEHAGHGEHSGAAEHGAHDEGTGSGNHHDKPAH